MFQLVDQADFLQQVQQSELLPLPTPRLSKQVTKLIKNKQLLSVNLRDNKITQGDGIPVFYEDDSQEIQRELKHRQLGCSINCDPLNEITIYQNELHISIIDYQFQYIQNEAFNNRQSLKSGMLTFDDRQRILLNAQSNFIGIWISGQELYPKYDQLIEPIYKYIQSKGKKIKFTQSASFLVIYFGVTATTFLVTSGKIISQQLTEKCEEQQPNLWENFLNKNSFTSDLHVSYNEMDQLENQIFQLQKEFNYMQSLLNGNTLTNADSIATNSNQQQLFHGLLSSQKIFTQRSHVDTRRGYHLSMGQLSENSFYQDAPLINAIQH